MLTYRRTNLFQSTAQTLVNTVNCVGVMGKGIARDFKEREPDMFKAYKSICERKQMAPGKLWLWKGAKNWVLNFPTKKHWRHPSKIEWIEQGLKKFADNYERLAIKEISFPLLGCGNGGLNWEDVRPVMERYLSDLQIPVFIHDFTVDIGLPEHMENVAYQLREESPSSLDFESFVSSLHRAVELADGELVDVETKDSIHASVRDGVLTLDENSKSWTFEEDDLWGVWVGLQRGYLTKSKAGWSAQGGGRSLISMLSVLPHVRPIQIQTKEGLPEVAVEYKPDANANETIAKQPEVA
jgi:O-acetyl-ADP-ribose deacetylase (regulator of RNase III)